MKKLFVPILEQTEGICAFFSTREGASPQSPYYNRETLEALGLQEHIAVWLQQVHGSAVAQVTAELAEAARKAGGPISGSGNGDGKEAVLSADHWGTLEEAGLQQVPAVTFGATDAVMTDVPGVLLSTVHADCIPVWFYDPVHRAVAVAHAGWKGTLAGIAAKTVQAMAEAYGTRPEDLQTAVGPGISLCCFQVGNEVYEQFAAAWPYAAEYRQEDTEPGKCKLDLKGLNKRQLADLGVRHIEVSPHCTYCEPELFCSYRRDGGMKARQGAGICLR